jgi:AhpD family alkylhydroperoxidase
MTAIRDHWGYLPSAAARLASSPHALDGFRKLNAIFESCTLDPTAREVVIMTVAARNGCHICVAIHTQRLTALGADAGLISALRNQAAPADERLAAIRLFTVRVLDSAGNVGDDALRAFLAHGYTRQNALEVVLGIGTYTLSTLANRLTAAPLDPPLVPYA